VEWWDTLHVLATFFSVVVLIVVALWWWRGAQIPPRS